MNNPKFSFSVILVNKLDRKKATQATDIPVKIIKENKYVISFLCFS